MKKFIVMLTALCVLALSGVATTVSAGVVSKTVHQECCKCCPDGCTCKDCDCCKTKCDCCKDKCTCGDCDKCKANCDCCKDKCTCGDCDKCKANDSAKCKGKKCKKSK